MSRRTLLIAVAAAAVIALVVYRTYFTPEARVRRAIGKAVAAVEHKQLLSVATFVSRGYSDPYGLTYESLLGGLNDLFSNYAEIRLPHRVTSVSISGATASAQITFRLQGKGAGRDETLLGTATEPAEAELLLREERGTWRLERVTRLTAPNLPSPPAAAP